MARIPGVERGKEGWLMHLAKRFSKRRVGAVTEPLQILGHQPWVLAAAGGYETASERATALPAKLKTLVDIKAAMMIGCPF